MQTPREKFQELLKKLFQFDCAELDFGIYRIMNHKRTAIEQFIEKDLLNGVATELTSGALAHESSLAQQLTEVAEQIRENFGEEAIDAEGNLDEKYNATPRGKQYLELRAKAAKAKSHPELESLIFNHLYSFFSRYYDEGDFMALRRYSKRDKYAIPYNGEEVYLHWANSDQYYIKTAENFTDYSYKHNGWTVKFTLRNAEVEQNNKKGAKRFFIPKPNDVVLDVTGQSLTVPFEYRPLTEQEEITYKSKPQETILSETATKLLELAKAEAGALSALATEKRKDADGNPVSLIDHHLRVYTRKNTSDFFIHKDLKGFLERELDFYLKNEVLNLDELEAGGEFRSDSWFQIMSTMKAVGRKIIAFVSQIENFQKCIFEKKKFVTEVNYCITLDRVSEEFYPEIIKNKEQIEEWKRLFHIQEIEQDTTQPGYSEPLKVAFLKEHKYLVLDTKFFSSTFRDRLLSLIPEIDQQCDGLLVCSENYQALRLLKPCYEHKVTCTYIDPPYNTGGDDFLYKDNYQYASWLTLMESRLMLSKSLLHFNGVFLCSIDDCSSELLRVLLQKIYGRSGFMANFVWRRRVTSSMSQSWISTDHEYVLAYSTNPEAVDVAGLTRDMTKYCIPDGKGGFYASMPLTVGMNRTQRPNQWYELVNPKTGTGYWPPQNRVWGYYPPTMKQKIEDDRIIWPENYPDRKMTTPRYKAYPDDAKRERKPLSTWIAEKNNGNSAIEEKEEASFVLESGKNEEGTRWLKTLLGEVGPIFPKPLSLLHGLIRQFAPDEATVMDIFAGSGTTGHAVIEANRDDEGNRKYLLVEFGGYFETVLIPRLQKIIYSKDWKEGKPKDRHNGISHCFKYLSLESYEDALNNITFKEIEPMLQFDDYVLSYMLDFETKESNTLLNIAKLDSPFDYKLRLHGKDEPLPVDLPETFNYLIGLHVDTRKAYDNKGTRYLVYRGKAEGRETVIIWRTIHGWGEKEMKADKDFIVAQKLTEGAEDIFVNGDSFVPGARSLDPLFKQRMFDGE